MPNCQGFTPPHSCHNRCEKRQCKRTSLPVQWVWKEVQKFQPHSYCVGVKRDWNMCVKTAPIPLQKSAKCQPLKESMAVLKFLLNKCIWQPQCRCPKLSQNSPKLSQKFSSVALIPCRKSRNYQQSSWSVFDQAKTLSFSAVIKCLSAVLWQPTVVLFCWFIMVVISVIGCPCK